MTKRVLKRVKLIPKQATAEERIAALEARLNAILEEVPLALKKWGESVDTNIKTLFENDQKLRGSIDILFENDQKLKRAAEAALNHTHPFVLVTR